MNARFALCVWLGVTSACIGAPFSTVEEKIPTSVVTITSNQIQKYFGANELKGIPLLDRSVDWNWFTNWPDQFVFRGRTYRLQLLDTTQGDYFKAIDSRAKARPGICFMASYNGGTNFPPPLDIHGVWSIDGSMSDKGVDVNGERVFMHQFYRTGGLYLFARGDATPESYMVEYFDGSGQLVGRNGWINGTYGYEWKGQTVDSPTFLDRCRGLFKVNNK